MYHEKKDVDYDEYVWRQGYKARNKTERLKEGIPQRIKQFEKIFKESSSLLTPGKILCLGARTGCEITAARKTGFDGSVGVDLYPVGDNVIEGDWHDLPFADNTFENVYTNSMDHCYDLERMIEEIKRVLIPEGRCFFQLLKKQRLTNEKGKKLYKNSRLNFLFWEHGRDIEKKFITSNFSLVSNWEDNKWENFILRVKE